MKYLIVSGGEVKEGFLTWIVKNGGFDVILAADAGMEALYRDHILPDIIVGDFDSVNPDTLEYFHDKEQIEVCMLNPVPELIMYWAISVCLVLVWRNR